MGVLIDYIKRKKFFLIAILAVLAVGISLEYYIALVDKEIEQSTANLQTKITKKTHAVITQSEGTVEVDLKGTGTWSPATANQVLSIGDSIRTPKGSKAIIIFGTQDMLILDENSQIKFKTMTSSNINIEQITGKSYSIIVKKDDHTFTVSKGEIKATALGTEFMFDVSPTGEGVSLLVYKSKVLFQYNDQRQEVGESSKATLNLKEKKIIKLAMEASDKEANKAYLSFVEKKSNAQEKTEDTTNQQASENKNSAQTTTNSNESEKKSDIYPSITQTSDNIGNVNTSSWGRSGSGGSISNNKISVGDRITFTVSADHPNKKAIEYRFSIQPAGGGFEAQRDWDSSNSYVWEVSDKYVGENIVVRCQISDRDSEARYGDGVDDYNYMTYSVSPAGVTGDIYPTIISTSDSLGHTNADSWGKNSNGGGQGFSDKTIRVGDKLTFTVNTQDPNNDSLKFRFSIQPSGEGFNVKRDWSDSGTFTWTVAESEVGSGVVIKCDIKDNDQYSRFGDGVDDYNYMVYDVVPAGVSSSIYPTITSSADSLGHTNTDSWGKNTGGGGYFEDNTVKVGSKITFTTRAQDPSGDPLQYQFSIQPPGGGFNAKQSWSNTNTFTWTVSEAELGENVIVMCQVKDGDQYSRFGNEVDDYNYMVYKVVR